MRVNDNETAANLLCRVQIWSIEDVAADAANSKAIFGPLAERIVGSCFCKKKTLLQPKRKKDATTMENMNMILMRVLNNNVNFDILGSSTLAS